MSEAAKKRVALISKEFKDGFEFVKNYPRSVTFFGSTRTKPGQEYYEKARRLGFRIASELRYAVISGGGPGIMEAANRGAFEAGGNSVGLNIKLPHEQEANPYLTDYMEFHYFFSRKVCLSFSAEAYVFMPGGFGTLDEFLEILTLVQTGKIPKAPIILVGADYWQDFKNLFSQSLLGQKYIEPNDLELFVITDDEEKVLNIIKNAPIRHGLVYKEETTDTNRKESPGGPLSDLSDLSAKNCIPCEGGVAPFTAEEANNYLGQISNWTLNDSNTIEKSYEFKDFDEALDFVDKVAHVAKTENHHPDINLHDYKKVTVKISTHAIGGLSENDFILASKIDQILR